MGKLDDSGFEYFSDLNPLARRITKETDDLISTVPDWENLTIAAQEQLIDQHFFKTDADNELDQVFPKLKINCGEKIVVDFDNEDGWTWQDEHSGPFSWASKSQQDLTIFDDAGEEEVVQEKPARPIRKKYQTPERDASVPRDNDAFAGTAADEIFQKFGITFKKGGSSDEGSADVSPREESKLMVSDGSHDNVACDTSDYSPQVERYDTSEASVLDTLTFVERSAVHDPSPTRSFVHEPSPTHNFNPEPSPIHSFVPEPSPIRSFVPEPSPTRSFHEASPSRSLVHERSPTRSIGSLRKKKQEVEQCLIEEDSFDDHGQVSPVYVEDPGESTTDQSPVFDYPESQPITTQPSSILDDNQDDDDDMVRSGFDFLDNW